MYTVTTLDVSNVTTNNYVIKFENINHGTKIFWSRTPLHCMKQVEFKKLSMKTHVLHD